MPAASATSTVASQPTVEAPSITRRLAALPYEGLLLLALVLIASFPFAGLKDLVLRGAGHWLYQAYLVGITGSYFVWLWTHGGQTLPMKTWRYRVVSRTGSPLTLFRAITRYFSAALFFGPACAGILLLFFPQRLSPIWTVWMFVPLLATILWAKFDAERQFLHDRLASTRLVTTD